MDTPTTPSPHRSEGRPVLDHLTAEIAALIRRIEDLEAHQYATGQGVNALASRVQALEGPRPSAFGYSVLGHSRGGRFAGARCQKGRQGRQMSRATPTSPNPQSPRTRPGKRKEGVKKRHGAPAGRHSQRRSCPDVL